MHAAGVSRSFKAKAKHMQSFRRFTYRYAVGQGKAAVVRARTRRRSVGLPHGLLADPRRLQMENGRAPRHVTLAGEEEEGPRVPSRGIRALA